MQLYCRLKPTILVVILSVSLPRWGQAVQVLPSQADHRQLVTERQTVDLLLADALQAFKSPARISHSGFTGKLSSNMDIVADKLLQAFKLEPYRADLLFSAASAEVYNRNIDRAVALYQQILTIAPEDVDAHSYLAAWLRYQGDKAGSAAHMHSLAELDTARHQRLEAVFATIDSVVGMPLSDHLSTQQIGGMDELTAIVTLGYALEPDGSMHQTLIRRLEKTRELARQLPGALIVVTGGVPQNNQTEASLMASWLVAQGVEARRIYQDNFARSTVENALYSRYALARHRIRQAVVISSGSHVRRAQALLTIACWDTGPKGIKFSSVAALDKPLTELQTTTANDIQGIYRDALKMMGLWSFRSYPLEER